MGGKLGWLAIGVTAAIGLALGSVAAQPVVPGQGLDAQARVGAYYFGGWSDSEDSLLMKQLTHGPYADRKPLYGWLDRDAQTMHQQLQWARSYGIDFFVFEWALHPEKELVPGINSGLERYRALADHAGVGYPLGLRERRPRRRLTR